jgi:hypothetical protein
VAYCGKGAQPITCDITAGKARDRIQVILKRVIIGASGLHVGGFLRQLFVQPVAFGRFLMSSRSYISLSLSQS